METTCRQASSRTREGGKADIGNTDHNSVSHKETVLSMLYSVAIHTKPTEIEYLAL